jgi:hypothetical protein
MITIKIIVVYIYHTNDNNKNNSGHATNAFDLLKIALGSLRLALRVISDLLFFCFWFF